MRTLFTLLIAMGGLTAYGQTLTPHVTSWMLNTTGGTGYNGISANCQAVQYTSDDVYVSATGIPDYTIGPWPGNPNQASDQGWVFQSQETRWKPPTILRRGWDKLQYL